MEFKKAILTGEREHLQEFIYEWYSGEKSEVPVIEPDMDIVLNVAEKHVKQLRGMATAFHLQTYILN
jgi:hypothetical protein